MDHAQRFQKLVQFRAPESLSDAIDAAARKHLQSKSEYIRRSVFESLKADGVDLSQLAGVPSPRPLLSIPQKVRTGNVVMDANLRAAHTREKTPLPNWCKRRPSNGLRFGWGCATVSLSAKKIKGLHENDFIMASKIDRLLNRPDGFLDHKQ